MPKSQHIVRWATADAGHREAAASDLPAAMMVFTAAIEIGAPVASIVRLADSGIARFNMDGC